MTTTNNKDDGKGLKQKIAIVGGGITGLSTAYYLTHDNKKTQTNEKARKEETQAYAITLFESSLKVGGHARTVTVNELNKKKDGVNTRRSIDMDVGAMVFNKTNYPNFMELLASLEVDTEESDMSLCISLDNGSIEWNSNGKGDVSTIASLAPTMLYFHNHVETWFDDVTQHPNDPRRYITVQEFLCRYNYPSKFATYYLLPMMAALWSSSLVDVLDFPMENLVGFLRNHCMLQIFNRPQWLTFEGRSRRYVEAMERALKDGGVDISTGVGISYMKECVDGEDGERMYELFDSNGVCVGRYHRVVFACPAPTIHSILNHSNTTLLLQEEGATKSDKEELVSLLSNIKAASNTVYLHSDERLMPRHKSNWASWNCIGSSDKLDFRKNSSAKNTSSVSHTSKRIMEGSEVGFGSVFSEKDTAKEEASMKECYITYHLNKLQNLKTSTNYFVSLNPHVKPDSSLIHETYDMMHAQFTLKSQESCQDIETNHQGKFGLYYSGAWMLGYGFHEDGCRSGRGIATRILAEDLAVADVSTDCLDAALVSPPPAIKKVAIVTKQTKSSLFTVFPFGGILYQMYQYWTNTLPKIICKRIVHSFLKASITQGTLELHSPNSKSNPTIFGEPNSSNKVSLQIYDDWFYVKIISEYDLGLARSYMAGYFNVLAPSLETLQHYNALYRTTNPAEESTKVLGDPIGLTRLFLLIIKNRESLVLPYSSSKPYQHAFSTGVGLTILSKIGQVYNYVQHLFRSNSEHGGSMENIHAHYNLSNSLFQTFLDTDVMMYSSALYSTCPLETKLVTDTLEQAQLQKMEELFRTANITLENGKDLTLLDIGFGWGGISILAAQKYKCRVVGISLSKEQTLYATRKVEELGLSHLITYQIIDYRTFARQAENKGKFDRIISCEMIEAVGHLYLGQYFASIQSLLTPRTGIFVMEAITTPENRYETYIKTTDFINTVIFPGSCCPSLHALVNASYNHSTLSLFSIRNLNMHYAETLREWRRRFNINQDRISRLGFDAVFARTWNYYLTYCEAAFFSQTEHCLILKWGWMDRGELFD